MDAERYGRQIEALSRARRSRTPEQLAAPYASLARKRFPGLLSANR
jgi:hypothetical protein